MENMAPTPRKKSITIVKRKRKRTLDFLQESDRLARLFVDEVLVRQNAWIQRMSFGIPVVRLSDCALRLVERLDDKR